MSATQTTPAPTVSSRGTPWSRYGNALLCALLVGTCMWVAWPVSRMGFEDDWSYARTAQVFAQTGHFAYNGWATAMLGWQVVWGALFIKLFGFSFTILRVSMLPLALATVVLLYRILVRFGVTERNAVVGTLTVGLSPLFLPMADSFMSDVPGLLVILACIYCCLRALASSTARGAILWLLIATASNVVGGTVRQIAWLGALVMVPTAAWMLRRRRGVLPVSAAIWVASCAAIWICMRWFVRQPGALSESVLTPLLYSGTKALVQIPGDLMAATFCCLLLAFPVVIAWLPTARALRGHTLGKMALIFSAFVLLQFTGQRSLPWLANILLTEFARYRTASMDSPGLDAFLLPLWARVAAGSLVIAAGLLLGLDVLRASAPSLAASTRNALRRPEVTLLAPFVVCYGLLLCPRAAIGGIFDRYLLGILPVVLVWLLLFFQERIGGRLPRTSFVILLVFAVSGIAGTHDWYAWQRARSAAMDEVIASRVPRTDVQGGLEADAWTQIVEHGYINTPRVQNPAGAYHKVPEDTTIATECRLDFATYTPVIHPRFTVAFDPKPCFAPTAYPPVRYTAWLPPFRRVVVVQAPIRSEAGR